MMLLVFFNQQEKSTEVWLANHYRRNSNN